ncbi:MAG: metallophosphoesterase, partial [Parabacteroides sp.]|nr:metallophosphoesterase [Parabacteroides sp.]
MNKKTIILGDIHGRTIWKDIIEKEQPDMVIFLGDYVSTHDNISGDDQFTNLVEILDYKEVNKDNCILLRGNHDTQHLGYYWASCSGLFHTVRNYMSDSSFKEEFLYKTQWVYTTSVKDEKYIFSHAGVSKEWLKWAQFDIQDINNQQPSEKFGFNGPSWDYCGESEAQPCTWIRPMALSCHAVEGWNQVVGHTPVTGNCPASLTMEN